MDMRSSNRAVLEVRGLTKRFGGLTAVKNLGFEVNSGEIFGLIGPNGSGKSTAMKSVMGIERPTSGEVIFEGEDVAGLPAHKIARKGFGMVFQHSRPLNRQTVLENIMVALLPDSLFMLFPDKALVERAKWIADRVGLGNVMNRRPPTLPFADLRRLELAKAIARDPKVVLVDEPFAGLTRAEVDVFSDLIRSFRDEGRAVMLVDSQRQERRGAGRPRARDVSRRGDRHRQGRGGHEERDGAAGLSRRRHRDPCAARDQLQGQGAAAPGRECQRVLWQGAGAGERLDPRP
ncbi:ABC-type branched-subunit amino acid transport system ATPase component [Bradyrhizobium sp. F1.13.4]